MWREGLDVVSTNEDDGMLFEKSGEESEVDVVVVVVVADEDDDDGQYGV